MTYILALVVAALVVAADQITKLLIVANLTSESCIPVLGGLFNIRFVENSGAAWSILEGKTWLLVAISLVIMAICIFMLIKKTYGSKLMFWAVSLVLAGGIGNFIDRIARGGKVVDFIEFGFIDFPVFNVADIAVCVGAGLIVLLFIIEAIGDYKKSKAAKLPQNAESEETK